MRYNHYEYGKNISESLKGINSFLESSYHESIEEVNEKLKKIKPPVLIAVEDLSETLSLKNDESAYTATEYTFIVLIHAKKGIASEILNARKDAKSFVREIASKVLIDSRDEEFGLEDLAEGELELEPVGPFGDNLYGIRVDFSINNQIGYELNNDMWQ